VPYRTAPPRTAPYRSPNACLYMPHSHASKHCAHPYIHTCIHRITLGMHLGRALPYIPYHTTHTWWSSWLRARARAHTARAPSRACGNAADCRRWIGAMYICAYVECGGCGGHCPARDGCLFALRGFVGSLPPRDGYRVRWLSSLCGRISTEIRGTRWVIYAVAFVLVDSNANSLHAVRWMEPRHLHAGGAVVYSMSSACLVSVRARLTPYMDMYGRHIFKQDNHHIHTSPPSTRAAAVVDECSPMSLRRSSCGTTTTTTAEVSNTYLLTYAGRLLRHLASHHSPGPINPFAICGIQTPNCREHYDTYKYIMYDDDDDDDSLIAVHTSRM